MIVQKLYLRGVRETTNVRPKGLYIDAFWHMVAILIFFPGHWEETGRLVVSEMPEAEGDTTAMDKVFLKPLRTDPEEWKRFTDTEEKKSLWNFLGLL